MIRIAHLVLLTLLFGVSGATADVVILSDGNRFSEIQVDRVVVAVGNPAFLAREVQDGRPIGTARMLDESRVVQIEFRGRGDSDTRPGGRAASLTLQNGKRFERVWVERCRRNEGRFVFEIREKSVPPGGVSYPVSAAEVTAITFREAEHNEVEEWAATTDTGPPAEAAPVTGISTGTGGSANPFDISRGIPGSPASANANLAGAPVEPARGVIPGRSADTGVAVAAESAGLPRPAGLLAGAAGTSGWASPGAPQTGVSPSNDPAASAAPESSGTEPGAGTASEPGVSGPPAVAPIELRPDQVNRTLLRRRVAVTGHVTHYRASWASRAPNILTLGYGGKTVDVVYWDDVDRALGERKADLTRLGSWVRATGDIEDYRGNLQIRVIHSNDLRIVPDAIPSEN